MNNHTQKIFVAWLCLTVAVMALSPDMVLAQVELRSDEYQVLIDPATLEVTLADSEGRGRQVSSPQAGLGVWRVVTSTPTSVLWALPERGLMVSAELHGKQLAVHFKSTGPGEVTWPAIEMDDAIRAYILPLYEGIYAPVNDHQWLQHLVDCGPMDTTADLSMPFIGLDVGDRTLTFIFDNIFDNRVVFNHGEAGAGVSVTHTFMPNWKTWEYTVIVAITDASPIAPAKAYREYLIKRGEFVTMDQKIEVNPKAKRLLGAPHAYLWDSGVFSHLDATDWKGFAAKLIAEGEGDTDTLGKRAWASLNDEARVAARQITREQWPYQYLKSVVAMQISDYLASRIDDESPDSSREAILAGFCDHFAGLVRPYDTWGDGISTKMIDALHEAGLERMLLCLGDLSSADLKPEAAQRADELGYLFGPYDSYHSIHPPQGDPDYDPDNTWDTAQFPAELYKTGAIVQEDGMKSAGFKKIGYHLSPLAARPYVEQRVNRYMSRVPFTAVFVDCDAFGQYFDDYHPDHTATKQDDLLARLDRLRWLSGAHGLVVGSEGGNACATSAIHFAHGMLTPVIGWGDPDLRDKDSPYYLGAYYPPDGPGIYMKQVPLKPSYMKFYYDPTYRLPLYQTVFHDSVIATHHWGNASLKFEDQVVTVSLLEQLYNVPPLYHLNMAEFKKHREHILTHGTFFSSLHRELARQAMTDFQWLTVDRLVQQTTFAEGTRIAANFSDQPVTIEGHDLPAHSALAIRPDGRILRYAP